MNLIPGSNGQQFFWKRSNGNLPGLGPTGQTEVSQALFDKVEQAKQQWESAVDALPELICVVDSKGNVIRANRAIERWTQESVLSIRGRNLHALLHPNCSDQACAVNSLLHRVREAASPSDGLESEAYDSILQKHVLVRIRPVNRGNSAQPISWVVIVQDISDRKRLEWAIELRNQRLTVLNEIGKAILAARSTEDIIGAALERIRRLVPCHQVSATLLDPDTAGCKILSIDFNGKVRRHEGDFSSSCARQSCCINPPDVRSIVPDLAQLTDRTPAEELFYQEGIRSLVRIPLNADGEYFGALIFGSQFAGAFRKEHANIGQEVADLITIAIQQTRLQQELERKNARLEAALQAREEMIQNVSHELRTPLTLIKGYTDLLKEGEFGPITPEQASTLDILDAKSDQLYAMVNRLLTLQTLDKSALQKTRFSLRRFLQATIDTWQARAADAGVILELDIPPDLPELVADQGLMEQVMNNLLENALKFSASSDTIRVRAWHDKGETTIAVSDTGIGIPSDKLEQIFERFYQVNGSQTRSVGGMGIGLALCRSIVNAHSGRMWAESPGDNQGTTFFVALPCDAAAISEQEPDEHTE